MVETSDEGSETKVVVVEVRLRSWCRPSETSESSIVVLFRI